jgi:hypothetical protein
MGGGGMEFCPFFLLIFKFARSQCWEMERIREEQPVDLPWAGAAASLKRDTGPKHPSSSDAHPNPGNCAIFYSYIWDPGWGKIRIRDPHKHLGSCFQEFSTLTTRIC